MSAGANQQLKTSNGAVEVSWWAPGGTTASGVEVEDVVIARIVDAVVEDTR
jgi:hypothetical protein